MRVFKYELTLGDLDEYNQLVLRMPVGSKILDVQVQKGIPCLLALVHPAHHSEPRTIEIVGTGHPLGTTDDYRYIATFQMHGGDLVFHAFEVR